jgi:hypothetical protein
MSNKIINLSGGIQVFGNLFDQKIRREKVCFCVVLFSVILMNYLRRETLAVEEIFCTTVLTSDVVQTML